MDFMKDRGIRKFYFYLVTVLIAATAFGFAIWGIYGRLIKKAMLDHDSAVCASLLLQGVDENVAARAFSQKGNGETGSELLEKIGLGEETGIVFLPDSFSVQKKALPWFGGLCLLLWSGILAGAGLFFFKRERLCRKAVLVVERFMEGDFSEHLPRVEEGCLYELFGKIDSLANILSSQKEEVCESRDFLKNTISDISHQLKTPLSALVMYNDIIIREAENKEAVLAFSRKTSAALCRIEGLIQALLKITRLDAGAVVFEKQEWFLAEVVQGALQELWVRAEAEGKEILLEGDENARISCDLQWTGEAVANLVKNALDYTERGGRVVISWAELSGASSISVSDNGKGIAEEDFYHIFKRFYRASGNGQGAGLGLPLAKSIAQGQGGTLSVGSREGEGTVFCITLPE